MKRSPGSHSCTASPWCVLVCWVAWSGLPPTAQACTLGARDGATLQQGAVQLAWRSSPAAIANGQPFTLQVAVCPAGAQLLRVDASMPEHRHGMNYRPTIKPLPAADAGGPVRWQVDGLLWHMAGRWELRWDVQHGGKTEVLRTSVTLR